MPILSGFPAGGAGELNFSVVAYSSEDDLPATAAENTIAVITDNEITSWVFSSTEPETPADGMVWLVTSAASQVAFNALKKNTAMMYPTSSLQYVSGAWVGKTAKIYQGGAWVGWERYIFKAGNQYESVTGGWTETGYKYYGSSYSVKAPTIADTITLETTSKNQACIAGTALKIDLTPYKTLTVVCDSRNVGDACSFTVVEDARDTYESYAVADAAIKLGENVMDVSDINGEYYIAMTITGSTSAPSNSVVISEVLLA